MYAKFFHKNVSKRKQCIKRIIDNTHPRYAQLVQHLKSFNILHHLAKRENCDIN